MFFLRLGCVPVTVRPPHPQNVSTTLPTVKMIVEVSKSSAILTSGATLKVIKSKEALAVVDARAWPTILDTDDLPKKKLAAVYKAPTPEMICYIDFSVSTTGMLAGVKVGHITFRLNRLKQIPSLLLMYFNGLNYEQIADQTAFLGAV